MLNCLFTFKSQRFLCGKTFIQPNTGAWLPSTCAMYNHAFSPNQPLPPYPLLLPLFPRLPHSRAAKPRFFAPRKTKKILRIFLKFSPKILRLRRPLHSYVNPCKYIIPTAFFLIKSLADQNDHLPSPAKPFINIKAAAPISPNNLLKLSPHTNLYASTLRSYPRSPKKLLPHFVTNYRRCHRRVKRFRSPYGNINLIAPLRSLLTDSVPLIPYNQSAPFRKNKLP